MQKRKSFGKLRDVLEMPDLIGIQLDSYANFLQRDVAPEKRKRQGLQEVFTEIFPIESFDKQMSLEFVSYEIGACSEQKSNVIDCIKDGKIYDAPLYVDFLLKVNGNEIPERVYMGDIPIMTDQGTFIINGAERVVISQLHRSPGICFEKTRHTSGRMLYSYRVIPDRGSWMDVQFDINDRIIIYLDRRRRRRKFYITTFLRAIGYPTNRDILKEIYEVKTCKLSSLLKLDPTDLAKYYTVDDITNANDIVLIDELTQLNVYPDSNIGSSRWAAITAFQSRNSFSGGTDRFVHCRSAIAMPNLKLSAWMPPSTVSRSPAKERISPVLPP